MRSSCPGCLRWRSRSSRTSPDRRSCCWPRTCCCARRAVARTVVRRLQGFGSDRDRRRARVPPVPAGGGRRWSACAGLDRRGPLARALVLTASGRLRAVTAGLRGQSDHRLEAVEGADAASAASTASRSGFVSSRAGSTVSSTSSRSSCASSPRTDAVDHEKCRARRFPSSGPGCGPRPAPSQAPARGARARGSP